MTSQAALAAQVIQASTWDARVSLMRRIPEDYGITAQPGIYSEIAEQVYVPHLRLDFAYVHWRQEYDLPHFAEAYDEAHRLTDGFRRIDADSLAQALQDSPPTLRIFRTIVGLTPQEFAAATGILARTTSAAGLSASRVKAVESGRTLRQSQARLCAEVIDQILTGQMFPDTGGADLRPKVDKPDTARGWDSVASAARQGVPYAVFLHQRHYGGAFRQLLDATSSRRGDVLEDAVEDLLNRHEVSFVRTGAGTQGESGRRFGLTVRPAPDFVVYDHTGSVRAILECKAANDGGTARDKASRFRALRNEATRLGGFPVFAVLGGLGWTRTRDALGPVIQATDGRTFTLATLEEMMSVQPFSALSNPGT
jgi:hypothetical protein